jgi:hypothetical protein
MITDGNLRLCAAQDIKAAATITTNCIDLGVAMRDIGQGEDLMLNINIPATFNGVATGGTFTVNAFVAHVPVDNSTNGSTGTAVIPSVAIGSVNSSTYVITTSAAHGMVPGQRVVLGGTLTGATANVDYFVRSTPSTTTLTLSTVPDGAILAITAATSGTIKGTVECVGSTGAQAVTRCVAGANFQICLNPAIVYPGTSAQRYLFVQFVNSTAVTTSATATVDLVLTPGDGRRNYPVGFSVI